jgi:two-component system, NarL family, sensor kinase
MRLFLIIILVVFPFFGRSQNAQDSLLNIINNGQLAKEDLLNARLQLGIEYYNIGEYEMATQQFVVIKSEGLKGTLVVTRSLNNLGNIEADQGNNASALNLYQEALESARVAKDRETQAHVLKNIGALYISWKQFEKSLEYYTKALNLAAELNDAMLIADCNNNLGTVYEQQEKFEEALKVYEIAFQMYGQAGDVGSQAMASSNRAIVYKTLGKYDQALNSYLFSLQVSDSLSDQWMSAAIRNNIGNLFGMQGNIDKALEYCESSIKIAKDIDAPEIEINAYESIADAYSVVKNYEKAFEYYKLFTQKNSEFINAENTRQLNELEVQYKAKEQQEQLETLTAEKKQLITSMIIVGIAISLIIVIVVLIVSNRQKRRMERELNYALYKGEQEERMRIARDLHDSIGQQLAVVKMRVSSLPDAQSESILIASKMVDDAITEVRSISHRLIPEALQFGIGPALNELKYKVEMSNSTRVNLNIEESNSIENFDKEIQINVYRIVQEVIGNMIKHANASEVTISLSHKDSGHLLLLSDNGVGMNADQIDKSNGIGWKNIKARVQVMNGKLDIRSNIGKGTQIALQW